MGNLFFERQKTLRGEWPTVLRKDILPKEVREQIWQIWEVGINHSIEEMASRHVIELRFALGVRILNDKCYVRDGYGDRKHSPSLELRTFLLESNNAEHALTAVELMCQSLKSAYQGGERAINQVNYRLRLAGVGYKFMGEQLIPVDDEQLTESAVIPAASLLNTRQFQPVYKYLTQAYVDYKSGSPKSLETAIDNAQKAVETLLKIIFDDCGITYGKADTYMPLMQKAKEKGLFLNVSDDKLNPLINTLKGLGEVRNQGGGHGSPIDKATDRLVRLAIHHATSNMLYIAETYLEDREEIVKKVKSNG